MGCNVKHCHHHQWTSESRRSFKEGVSLLYSPAVRFPFVLQLLANNLSHSIVKKLHPSSLFTFSVAYLSIVFNVLIRFFFCIVSSIVHHLPISFRIAYHFYLAEFFVLSMFPPIRQYFLKETIVNRSTESIPLSPLFRLSSLTNYNSLQVLETGYLFNLFSSNFVFTVLLFVQITVPFVFFTFILIPCFSQLFNFFNV